ncbi:transglycosylase [Calderihabitans maritimus]|uniref:Transglycosylase n=1 Tax=Calderihabitans maritimus TaxID=1246530 RepID=A0A1Z5HNX7_9FIRM|nr:lytic transglycosylase domain-containing protein [Calderihabitans maritimus]GAW91232.1 transglycosylase [Calderihabitans maritimus]
MKVLIGLLKYRWIRKTLFLMLLVVGSYYFFSSFDLEPYEDKFIEFMARQDPPALVRGEEKPFVGFQLDTRKRIPELKVDLEETIRYKKEKWVAFKTGVAKTFQALGSIFWFNGEGNGTRSQPPEAVAATSRRLGEEDIREKLQEMVNIDAGTAAILRENIHQAALALYQFITVRVYRYGDERVVVAQDDQGRTVMLPYDPSHRILQWADYIQAAAEKYDLDPALIAAVIEQESGGNPQAVSRAGAIGLMQLMPGTAKMLGVNPYDPVQNIEGGTRYLAWQLKEFGNLTEALAAYNAGPGNVRNGRYRYIAETQNYIRRVPRLMEKYRKLMKEL